MNKSHKHLRELKEFQNGYKKKKRSSFILSISTRSPPSKKKNAKNFQRRVANIWYTDIERKKKEKRFSRAQGANDRQLRHASSF